MHKLQRLKQLKKNLNLQTNNEREAKMASLDALNILLQVGSVVTISFTLIVFATLNYRNKH